MQFNLDPVHIGFVFLSGSLAYMVFAVIIGPLSDKLVSLLRVQCIRTLFIQVPSTLPIYMKPGSAVNCSLCSIVTGQNNLLCLQYEGIYILVHTVSSTILELLESCCYLTPLAPVLKSSSSLVVRAVNLCS